MRVGVEYVAPGPVASKAKQALVRPDPQSACRIFSQCPDLPRPLRRHGGNQREGVACGIVALQSAAAPVPQRAVAALGEGVGDMRIVVVQVALDQDALGPARDRLVSVC